MKGITALITTFLFLISFQAIACFCSPPTDPAKLYQHADLVFSAKVIATNKTNIFDIKIYTIWKGDSKFIKNINLYSSGFGTGSCDYTLKDGEKHLFYLFNRPYKNQENLIEATICSGSKPLSEANKDIEYLNSF